MRRRSEASRTRDYMRASEVFLIREGGEMCYATVQVTEKPTARRGCSRASCTGSRGSTGKLVSALARAQ